MAERPVLTEVVDELTVFQDTVVRHATRPAGRKVPALPNRVLTEVVNDLVEIDDMAAAEADELDGTAEGEAEAGPEPTA